MEEEGRRMALVWSAVIMGRDKVKRESAVLVLGTDVMWSTHLDGNCGHAGVVCTGAK